MGEACVDFYCEPRTPCVPFAVVPPLRGYNSCDEDTGCVSRWWTVGNETCGDAGPTCVPWYHDGEAPPGLEIWACA